MTCDKLGAFPMFLVDKEISAVTVKNGSKLSVSELLMSLIRETNQERLHDKPKVSY